MGTEVMRKVRSTDGTEIAVFSVGEGPPLVLVHGTSAAHARLMAAFEPLAKRYTIHSIDRRGRGSSGDTQPYAIEREFEDVAAVVGSIPGPVTLFGHSFGALCALEASAVVQNLARLVLYEPAFPSDGQPIADPASERMEALLAAGQREAALQVFFREVAQVPEHELAVLRTHPAWPGRIAAAHTIPRENRAESAYRFDPDRFASMTTPTLLLLGGDSPPLFSAPTRLLENVLPNVRVTVMPGQQHVAMDTAPELFLQEVTAFLAE